MSGEGPQFDSSGRCVLRDWVGNHIYLNKETWELKCSKPERWYLQWNYELLKECLEKPDEVRKSTKNENSVVAYKSIERVQILQNVTANAPKAYIAVVIQKQARYIQTVLFLDRMKEGEKIWPL